MKQTIHDLLAKYRAAAQSDREKGTYFEELIRTYFRSEASGIVNDAYLWATDTMGNAKYTLELSLRVITVSLETIKIVNALPVLDLEPAKTS